VKRLLLGATALAASYALILATLLFLGSPGTKRHHVESVLFVFVVLGLAHIVVSRPDGVEAPVIKPRLSYAVVLAVIGAAGYWRALQVGLLSDDYVLRDWAQTGHFLGVGSPFARPVGLWLWRCVLEAGGQAPALHLISLGLHVLNTILAVSVARHLGLGRLGCVVTAVAFIAWPTQVEPVFWASAIFDVLTTSCLLAAIVLSFRLRSTRRTVLTVAGIAALTTVALLTKESAICLPALWFVCRFPEWRRAGIERREIAAVAAVCACCAGYVGWRLAADLPMFGAPSLTRYVLKEQVSRTFGTLAVPFADRILHLHPWTGILTSLTAITLGFAVASGRRSTRQIIALQGLLWCLVASAPTIGFLLIGADLDGTRYLYLPLVGWGVFMGAACEQLAGHRITFRVMLSLLGATVAIALVQAQLTMGDWSRAALERDRLLAEAVAAADRAHCGRVTVAGLPPRYRGAQLFNNGFAEALGDLGPRVGGERTCQFEWTDLGFRER
jgi:hypothetical protein